MNIGGPLGITLLVENNPKIEGFYQLNLSIWLGLSPVVKTNAKDVLELLEKDPSQVDLIIARAIINKEEVAKILINYQKKKGTNIPIVVIGPCDPLEGSFAHIENSMQLKPLIKASAKALKITAIEMTNKVVPDFFPIPISNFRNLNRTVCIVYTQDNSENKKFHFCLDKLQDIDKNSIEKLAKGGTEFLYVDKMDRLDFVNNLTSEFMSQLDSSQLSEDEQLTTSEKSVELLSKKLLTIGVTEETIVLAKKSMDAMKKNVKTNPQMAKLLDRLLKNQSSYLFKHTQIVTYVALHIIRNIDWGNPEQEDKINFIAFFHDIVLERDEQAMIHTTAELKKANFQPTEKTLVERHAQLAAEIVSKFPHTPMGADQIIRQHHGMLNGIGFSEHYGGNISPITMVFIVAEAFTRIVLKREDTPIVRKELLAEIKAEFPNARFQKIIDLLSEITF